jgi:SAM-dependent methyltransferase
MKPSVINGRSRLLALRETGNAIARDMQSLGERFAQLAAADSAPRVVQAHQLFQTPEPLADRLAGMFESFGRVLEPSAGLGRLYHAVRRRTNSAQITMVDNSAECCGELYRLAIADQHAELVQGDFLTMDADRLGVFDAIIMNPPFKMGTDVKHIAHARKFLAPGGRLVSLCANGPRQRAALQGVAAEWIDLPAGTFKGEGTNVGAAIVIFDAQRMEDLA